MKELTARTPVTVAPPAVTTKPLAVTVAPEETDMLPLGTVASPFAATWGGEVTGEQNTHTHQNKHTPH